MDVFTKREEREPYPESFALVQSFAGNKRF